MKLKTTAALSAAILLAACSSPTKVKMERPNESAKIGKVCIIHNPKVSVPQDLDGKFAAALSANGIDSEVVAPRDRKLYSESCPYNLRYFRVKADAGTIHKMDAILRTPEYGVSTVGYSVSGEPQWRKSPDLQKQVDGIVARLLNRPAR